MVMVTRYAKLKTADGEREEKKREKLFSEKQRRDGNLY